MKMKKAIDSENGLNSPYSIIFTTTTCRQTLAQRRCPSCRPFIIQDHGQQRSRHPPSIHRKGWHQLENHYEQVPHHEVLPEATGQVECVIRVKQKPQSKRQRDPHHNDHID